MNLPQSGLLDLQGLAEVRFRRREVSTCTLQLCQMAKADGHVGMVIAQGSLPNVQRRREQRLGSWKFPLLQKQHSPVGQKRGEFWMFFVQAYLGDPVRLPVERIGFRGVPLYGGDSPQPSQVGDKSGVQRIRTTLSDRKSTRLNSSHIQKSRMPSSA